MPRKKPAPTADSAKAAIAQKLDVLTNEFLDACLGVGDFSELDDKTRASMLVKAMEWGVGKPPQGTLAATETEQGLIIE